MPPPACCRTIARLHRVTDHSHCGYAGSAGHCWDCRRHTGQVCHYWATGLGAGPNSPTHPSRRQGSRIRDSHCRNRGHSPVHHTIHRNTRCRRTGHDFRRHNLGLDCSCNSLPAEMIPSTHRGIAPTRHRGRRGHCPKLALGNTCRSSRPFPADSSGYGDNCLSRSARQREARPAEFVRTALPAPVTGSFV